MSLKKRFITFIILITIIPITLVAFSSYYLKSKFYVNKEKELTRNQIIHIENTLINSIKEDQNLLNFLSIEFKNRNPDDFIKIMKNFINEKSEYTLIYYGLDNTGDYTMISRDYFINKNTKKTNRLYLPLDYDPRKRPWYIGTKKTNKFYFSGIYLDMVTKESIATFSVPLYKNDSFYGVLSLDMDLESFSKLLELDSFFLENSVNILDNNGYIVLSSSKQGLGIKYHNFENLKGKYGDFSIGNDLYIYEFISPLNSYIVAKINKKIIFKEFDTEKKYITVIVLVSLFLSVIIASMFFEFLEIFLRKIKFYLEKIAQGNYKNEFIELEKIVGKNKDFNEIKKSLEIMQEKIENRELSLEKLANFDTLTKIYNRRYLFKILEEEYEKSTIENISFVIAILDLDDFKLINDTFGHQVGDEVLKKVSIVMQDNIRSVDFLGRYGGEEFLIIFPNSNINTAIEILENVRKSILRISWKEKNLKVSTSIGVASYTPNSNIKNILKLADDNLYKAKRKGKNRTETNLSITNF